MASDLEATFARLYDSARQDLYAYIYRSVREEHTAQDILQDSFTNFYRVFQQRGRALPDDEQCRMYVFKIARNLMINHGKRAYTRRVDLVENYEEGRAARHSGRGASPEDEVVSRMQTEENEELLQESLQQLSEEHRTALLLRYQLEMRLEEIAGILSLSVSSVSRLLQRAEQALLHEGQKLGLKPGGDG